MKVVYSDFSSFASEFGETDTKGGESSLRRGNSVRQNRDGKTEKKSQLRKRKLAGKDSRRSPSTTSSSRMVVSSLKLVVIAKKVFNLKLLAVEIYFSLLRLVDWIDLIIKIQRSLTSWFD